MNRKLYHQAIIDKSDTVVMSASTLMASLEALAKALEQQSFQGQFTDQWGWQGTPFAAADLAAMSRQIAEDIRVVDWSKVSESARMRFADLASRVDKAKNAIVPSMHGGYMSLDAIMNTLVGVDLLLRGFVSEDVVHATLKPATTLGRRVKLANEQLDSAVARIDGLEKTTDRILRATEAAEKLDVTTDELDQAVKFVGNAKESVIKYQIAAEAAVKEAASINAALRAQGDSAESIMKKINLAYGAATTIGLAKSFDDKAKELNKSMGLWVIVLVGALLMGVLVGQDRFPQLMSALAGKPDWGVVVMYMTISALSLGPGVWLAWIATKQIGQRFRLAEDYGYKASLAKAYEGYRNEAEGLDPIFSAQLFAVALGRLEELPLRTIAKDVSGSPLNDLLQSRQFKEHMEKVPGFQGIMIGLLRRVMPQGAVDKWMKENPMKKSDDPGQD